MEQVLAKPDVTAFMVWLGGYLSVFVLLLWWSRQFRECFLDWITLKDPFGLRFWGQNILFAAFTLAYFAVAVLFLGG